jgi:hypothetical protein
VEVGLPPRATSFTLAEMPQEVGSGSRLCFTRDAILSVDAATGAAEYAIRVGDVVRAATFVNVRRAKDGVFIVQGNTDVEVTFGRGPVRKITAAELARSGGAVVLTLTADGH